MWLIGWFLTGLCLYILSTWLLWSIENLSCLSSNNQKSLQLPLPTPSLVTLSNCKSLISDWCKTKSFGARKQLCDISSKKQVWTNLCNKFWPAFLGSAHFKPRLHLFIQYFLFKKLEKKYWVNIQKKRLFEFAARGWLREIWKLFVPFCI